MLHVNYEKLHFSCVVLSHMSGMDHLTLEESLATLELSISGTRLSEETRTINHVGTIGVRKSK